MKLVLAACLLTACAVDPSPSPGDLPEGMEIDMHPGQMDQGVTQLLARSLNCVKQMRVTGAGPYSVQCAVGYAISDAGVQLAYSATDANGATWVSARAATPKSFDEQGDGIVVFALQAMDAPAMGTLTVKIHLVDDAQGSSSNELTETILVSE